MASSTGTLLMLFIHYSNLYENGISFILITFIYQNCSYYIYFLYALCGWLCRISSVHAAQTGIRVLRTCDPKPPSGMPAKATHRGHRVSARPLRYRVLTQVAERRDILVHFLSACLNLFSLFFRLFSLFFAVLSIFSPFCL
jgi:hypothetical protein